MKRFPVGGGRGGTVVTNDLCINCFVLFITGDNVIGRHESCSISIPLKVRS